MPGENSETAAKLAALFEAESRDVLRLQWYAEAADVDGYPELAASFRAIGEEKAGHAQGLLEFVDGLDRDTSENLAAALTAVDRSVVLQEARDAAVSEGRDDVAEWIDTMDSAGQRHLDRLRTDGDTIR